jgi:hypothetical protein
MNAKNPFYILGLATTATPGEIEREGRKLLSLLEVGSAKAAFYEWPGGKLPRDATMVREALAALRDPKRREHHAALVDLVAPRESAAPSHATAPDAPFPEAFE